MFLADVLSDIVAQIAAEGLFGMIVCRLKKLFGRHAPASAALDETAALERRRKRVERPRSID